MSCHRAIVIAIALTACPKKSDDYIRCKAQLNEVDLNLVCIDQCTVYGTVTAISCKIHPSLTLILPLHLNSPRKDRSQLRIKILKLTEITHCLGATTDRQACLECGHIGDNDGLPDCGIRAVGS